VNLFFYNPLCVVFLSEQFFSFEIRGEVQKRAAFIDDFVGRGGQTTEV
jgi:hypothetical protein